jgi:hypothetical protein
VVAGATNVSSAPSTRTGDGQVTITYDPTTDSCPSGDDDDDNRDDKKSAASAATPTPAVAVVAEARFTG